MEKLNLNRARVRLRKIGFQITKTETGFETHPYGNRQDRYETDCLQDALAAAEWIYKTEANRSGK